MPSATFRAGGGDHGDGPGGNNNNDDEDDEEEGGISEERVVWNAPVSSASAMAVEFLAWATEQEQAYRVFCRAFLPGLIARKVEGASSKGSGAVCSKVDVKGSGLGALRFACLPNVFMLIADFSGVRL